MPQLSPLNWALISIIILFLIFMVKMFFSFLTAKKLKFLTENKILSPSSFSKWYW